MASYYAIADMVQATLFNDPKGMATNIDPIRLRNYPAANRLVKKAVVKEQSGLDYRWPLDFGGPNSATTFGPFHRPTRSVGNQLTKASMQLRNLRNDFSFDEVEDEMNSPPAEIVDIIKLREQNCMVRLTELIEEKFWSFADTTDDDSPQGILYWLPYCASAGFVGTTSGSHTTVANVSPTTYTGWKSYGDQYVAVTEDDLIDKITLAMDATMFEAPLDNMMVPEFANSQTFELYMNLTTARAIEKLAKDQNDDLGPDLDWAHNRAMIRGNMLNKVAKLDSNTRSPVFGINWSQIQNRVRRGYWMKRKLLKDDPAQPLTVSVDIFCIYNIIMHSRRLGGFNIAKA